MRKSQCPWPGRRKSRSGTYLILKRSRVVIFFFFFKEKKGRNPPRLKATRLKKVNARWTVASSRLGTVFASPGSRKKDASYFIFPYFVNGLPRDHLLRSVKFANKFSMVIKLAPRFFLSIGQWNERSICQSTRGRLSFINSWSDDRGRSRGRPTVVPVDRYREVSRGSRGCESLLP